MKGSLHWLGKSKSFWWQAEVRGEKLWDRYKLKDKGKGVRVEEEILII